MTHLITTLLRPMYVMHAHRLTCVSLLCVFWLSLANMAQAQIATQYATMSRHSDGTYALNADYRLNLPQQLQDAINHGTPVSFQVEFRINRPRWYWSSETLNSFGREQRVSFNSLTREYRVTLGSEQYRYKTLYEALLNVSRVSQWRVLSPSQYTPGEQLEGSVRIYLNTSKLPRSYQLNSLTNQGWGLNSDWYRFTFTPR